jgi:predicted short-subunit dehydrogenase-like oxidoreductase (DUF2520 family)
MDIVFVGAGRLATNLARALHDKGHTIVSVYSRTMDAARCLADAVGAEPADSVEALPLDADVFILAVSDAALPVLIPQLSSHSRDAIFLHTAGSVPMSVFGDHPHHGVFYPMQTFSKERRVDFTHLPVFLEACDDLTMTTARSLAASVTDNIHLLDSDRRRYLHLAAVFANNFANHCFTLAARQLEQHGMSFDVMLPLVAETAEKVKTMHPRQAQTGPAVRYDKDVIGRQSDLLRDDPLTQQIYNLMSKSIYDNDKL